MEKIVWQVIAVSFSVILIPMMGYPAVNLPWHTNYECSEWRQSDGRSDCDGLSQFGGWTASDNEEQITSSANNTNADSGKGQRHWVGDCVNNNSGSE